MKNKKVFGILALVLALLPIVAMFFINDLSILKTFIVVSILLEIAAVVCGFIGKKEAKGLSIAGIVIGIIGTILLCFALIGFSAFESATDCVVKGDGIAVCNYMGQEIEVPVEMLSEDQMKKEE